MEQKLYKTVNSAGISSIVTGIIAVVAGLACFMEAQKVERSNAARYGVRRVSWQGIASSILLIIQIILLFSAVYLSYLAEGKGGLIVGILGVAAFVLAIVSVGLSIWGLLKKEQNHAGCMVGGIGSLLIAAGIIIICTIL